MLQREEPFTGRIAGIMMHDLQTQTARGQSGRSFAAGHAWPARIMPDTGIVSHVRQDRAKTQSDAPVRGGKKHFMNINNLHIVTECPAVGIQENQ